MNLSTKIAYNTLVQLISKVVSTALGLLAIALIARYLGQQGFGEYTTVMTFLSFFAIIADLGLTLVTVQMISRPGADQDHILGNLLGLRLVSAILFLGLAPLSVLFFPYSGVIKLAIAITTLSFLAIALNQILVGLFQKHLRMDKVAIAEVISRAALALGFFIAIRLDSGLIGIMVVTVISSAISFVLHYIFSRGLVRIKLYFDFGYWRKIIIRSWPLALTIVLNLVYLKTDALLLSIIPRESQIGIIAEVGLYGAAYKVIDVLITFPFMFAGIILPIMTACWVSGKKQEFKDILQKSFDIMVMFALPVLIGTQFIAQDVMVLVAGEEFATSGAILRVLIGAAVLIYLGVMFSHAIIAINKQRQIIGAYFFTAITAVIGYFVFIPRFSYWGAAWVTIYSELAIALAAAYLVWKYTRFLPALRLLFKSLLASSVMAVLLYFAKVNYSLSLFSLVTIAVISYTLALYLLQGIKKQDILVLFNK